VTSDARLHGVNRGKDDLSQWIDEHYGTRTSKGSIKLQKLALVRRMFKGSDADQARLRFAEEIVKDPSRNVSRAARAVGYSSRFGPKLYAHPKVHLYTDALVEAGYGVLSEAEADLGKLAMPAAEVIRRFSEIAKVSMGDFISVEDPEPATEDGPGDPSKSFPFFNWRKIKEAKQARFIKKLKIKSGFNQAVDGGTALPWTETEIELHDAKDALKELARIYGMYKDANALPNENEVLWKAMLSAIPPEQLRGVYLNMLQQQQGGDV